MKRKFTNRQKEAIKGYYLSRKSKFQPRDKIKCLDEISDSIKNSRNIKYFAACAGTFWFTWKDGSRTVHSEKNWWGMKKVRRDVWC